MGIATPDISTQRRIAALERKIDQLERLLLKQSRPEKHTTPLYARLWRATLNANMSSGTAAADLLELDGTDTLLDITVSDPINLVEMLESGDPCYCIEQLDMDGTRKFIAIGNPAVNVKTFARFTLDAALAKTDASVQADITAQYGPGKDHASITNITIYNVAAASNYIFEGASGAAGIIFWDHDNAKWWIIQMECP
jgi:hypothetical protein